MARSHRLRPIRARRWRVGDLGTGMIPTIAMSLSMLLGIWVGVIIGRSGWSLTASLDRYAKRLEARIDARYRRNVERRRG